MTTQPSFADLSPIRTLADVRAVEAQGWPTDLPETTYALLVQAADSYGDLPALTFFETADRFEDVERYSYRDLLARVTQAANLFHSLGARTGDVIAIILPNLPEMHFALWGAEAAGIALPINPLLEAAAIAGMLQGAGAKIVVTLGPSASPGLYEKVGAALQTIASNAQLVVVDPDRAAALAPERVGGISFTQRSAAQRSGALDNPRPPRGADTASLFGTGGTTGLPKLARRTHANEIANTWMAARLLGEGLRRADVIFSGLPLFHVNGALVTGLVAFLRGAQILMGTGMGFRAPGLMERFWGIVAHHRVASFSGVPTVYASLLQHPIGEADLSSLRFGICGAAPMAAELIHQFEAATGIRILEGYGLTESTCVVSTNPFSGEKRVGSVGLPLPFQQVRISIADRGGEREAEVGEPGSVLIRGPNTFQGYCDPRHEAGVWVELDGSRWLDTGDLGFKDNDGYLWLKGRSKDLIIRGGHNLDPQMIEEAFHHHPDVVLAAAIGRPDARAGEIPVVYVQLKPGAAVTAAELLAACDHLIAERAARPKAVRILANLPLTAVGKVFKPALREMERSLIQDDAEVLA